MWVILVSHEDIFRFQIVQKWLSYGPKHDAEKRALSPNLGSLADNMAKSQYFWVRPTLYERLDVLIYDPIYSLIFVQM